jgi:eukaryotic-like serine/threonine-protein kinase
VDASTWENGVVLQLATTLASRYRVHRHIGSGSFAEAYLATDLAEEREVAVKILRPDYAADSHAIARFEREARATETIDHPNVIRILDHGREDDLRFIVMEYVDGRNLKHLIRERAPLPTDEAVHVARQILAGLGAIHAAGIVHRDVKPQNVLLTSDGGAKVGDFSIARIADDTGLTATGMTLGTAAYMAPEQAIGEPVDARADLYATGVILYELLTGRLPFTGDNPIEVIYQQVHDDPPRPRALNASIPPALEAVVLQALAKEPAERFASAERMTVALESATLPDEATRPMAAGAVPAALLPAAAAAAASRGTARGTTRGSPLSGGSTGRILAVPLALVAGLLVLGALFALPPSNGEESVVSSPRASADPAPENAASGGAEEPPITTSEPQQAPASVPEPPAQPATDAEQTDDDANAQGEERDKEQEKREREAEKERQKQERERQKQEREAERERQKAEKEQGQGRGHGQGQGQGQQQQPGTGGGNPPAQSDDDDDWDDDD